MLRLNCIRTHMKIASIAWYSKMLRMCMLGDYVQDGVSLILLVGNKYTTLLTVYWSTLCQCFCIRAARAICTSGVHV